MFRRSAEAGYAWGQWCLSWYVDEPDNLVWLEKGAAQGDPSALFRRAYYAWSGEYGFVNKERAMQLWLQGAPGS